MIRRVMTAVALAGALAGAGLMGGPAYASGPICPDVPVDTVSEPCGGDGGGGGGGGGTPAYVLQGVIQKGDIDRDGPRAWVEIRGYSRLANASNDRVDADYISVDCTAYDAFGYRHDFDEESNGALVDVHFQSNAVTGIGSYYRTITVNCTHHAKKYGIAYDTTSTQQIYIPE